MFSGTTIMKDPTIDGAITATAATLAALKDRDVKNGAARFDTLDGSWPGEGVRDDGRYVELAIPVTTGTFTLGSISVGGGSGGGGNMHWDIVYSLASDFSSPTVLGADLNGVKDALTTNTYPGIGVNVSAGQTLRLRVYPYYTTASTGKFFMLANVVISGVTN
jgi:hypothetical protein